MPMMVAVRYSGRVLAIGGLLALAASAVAQESTQGFSPDERARLLAGELVARPITRREGAYHLVGGVSWQIVRAPVDEVWEVVLNTAIYPRLIPSLDEIEVIEEREDLRVVRMHHSYSVASAEYFSRVRIDRDNHQIRFDLDRSRPHQLRAGRGFLSLRTHRGDTIVSWGVLADVGAGMVMQVFGPLLHDWMLRVPRCIRDEVEPGHFNVC